MKKYGDKKSGMAPKSKGQANMPSELVMKNYPSASQGCAESYNDTREGIDMMASSNKKQIMKNPGGRY